MADTNFRGPVNAMGALEVNAATVAIEPFDGPSMFYQGQAAPDLRSAPFAKDSNRSGQQMAFLQGQDVIALDNVPQARGTAMLAVATTAADRVTVALATVGIAGVASACSIAVGVPIIPIGTTVATNVIALDFGFTTGTTVANSSTVTVINSDFFRTGGWIIVGNVGNSAATRSLVTQVTAVPTSTTINIFPVAATALASVPIGQANLFNSSELPIGTPFGPATASANAHSFGGAFASGLARVMNPRETLSRTITMNGTTAGGAFPLICSAVVNGWDVWGNPMSEIISASTATTVSGKKAFKYIGSIVLGTTSATAAAFGLGDTFGLPLRSDQWEHVQASWAGTASVNSNGFTNAVFSAATGTSGDVRGTIQVSTAAMTGTLTTAVTASATNGTSRLTVIQHVGVWNTIFATPLNPAPMFGTAQNTAIT